MQDNSISKKDGTTDAFKDNENASLNKTMAGRKLQVSEILEKLGDFGLFQYSVLILCILVSIATSASPMALSFIMKDPDFMCKDSQGGEYECNQVHACSNPNGYTLKYDIYSLVIKHQLYCTRRWVRVWGQSVLFIISSLLSTIGMFFLEKYGRKLIFRVVTVGIFVFNLLLLVSDSFWFDITVLTFLWAFAYLFFTNFYVYSTEMFNGKWRSVANSTFFLFNYLVKIVYVLINLMISSYYGNYILMIVLGAIFLPLSYFLTETPYYLHKKGDVEALKRNLENINRINNKNKPDIIEENNKMIAYSLHIEELNEKDLINISVVEIGRKAKKTIFNENFTLRSYLAHITLIIISIIPNYIGGALGDNIPYKLGIDNIYVSSALFVSVLVLSNLALMFWLHKIPRKNGNIVSVLILLVFSLIFIVFRVLGIHHSKPIRYVELALTLVSAGIGMVQFLLISRYVNEVFPTKIRAVSIAFVLEIGRISMFLANIIDPLSEKADVHPFALIGIFYLISLPCFWMYEETLNKPTKN